jgi:Acetyltransferase (GNAT) family
VIGGTHGRGYGTRLMQAVEQEARARGHHEIVLHTHDFRRPSSTESSGSRQAGLKNSPEAINSSKWSRRCDPPIPPPAEARPEAQGQTAGWLVWGKSRRKAQCLPCIR